MTEAVYTSWSTKKGGVWSSTVGVVFILLGMIAIVEPGIASLALTILVGWLLIFGGVANLIATFWASAVGRVIWQVILGIMYVAGGIYFVTHPLLGVATLTLLLAGIILAQAAVQFIMYIRTRNEARSGWILANGLISLLLGGLIWFHWPSSSVWAIGTLVGVNLLMTGFSRLMRHDYA